MIKSPLVVPSILFIGGIFLSSLITFNRNLILILAFVALVFAIKLKRFRTLFILLIILFFGIARIEHNFPPNHLKTIIEKKGKLQNVVEGRITSDVKQKASGYLFDLSLFKIGSITTSGKIEMYTYQRGLEYGDIVSTTAVINRINQTFNPTNHNFEHFAMLKGVFAKGSNKTKIVVLDKAANPFFKLVYRAKKFLTNRIERRFEKGEEFVKAILLGEKSSLGETKELFIRAGVSHVLAISGLHVAVIAFVLLTVLNLTCSRNISRVLTVLVLIFYCAICNFVPSVSRATIMISVYLFAKVFKRVPNPNNTIAASAIAIGILSPLDVLTISFQLSFLAVVSLANFIPKTSFSFENLPTFRRFSKKVLVGLWRGVLVSGIVTIFLVPVTLKHFNQINLNSIISNILIIPLTAPVLILALLVIFLPFGYTLFLRSFELVYSLLILLVEGFSNFPFFWKNIYFSSTLSVITLLALILIFSLKGRKKFLFATTVILILLPTFFFGRMATTKKMEIVFFDAGMGDLTLVKTKGGKTIVIDCGPNSFSFKISAMPYFIRNSIKRVDLLVLTHPHKDHYGGAFALLKDFDVEKVVITDEFKRSQIWDSFESNLALSQSQILTINDTLTIFREEDFSLLALHPAKEFVSSSTNNASMVLRLDMEKFSLLLTGDIEKQAENFLISNYSALLDVDMLKVAHHGSNSSTSEGFLQATTPQYAYIFATSDNYFGFPHTTTIKTLGEIKTFVSGSQGGLKITTDGKSAEFTTYKDFQSFTDFSF